MKYLTRSTWKIKRDAAQRLFPVAQSVIGTWLNMTLAVTGADLLQSIAPLQPGKLRRGQPVFLLAARLCPKSVFMGVGDSISTAVVQG
jgi:hypothetical protein